MGAAAPGESCAPRADAAAQAGRAGVLAPEADRAGVLAPEWPGVASRDEAVLEADAGVRGSRESRFGGVDGAP